MEKTVKKFKFSKILAVCLILVSCYFVVRFVVLRNEYNHRHANYNSIIAKCEAVEEKNDRLAEIEKLLNSGDNDQYIERIARERGYVMPGERVYIDKSVVK